MNYSNIQQGNLFRYAGQFRSQYPIVTILGEEEREDGKFNYKIKFNSDGKNLDIGYNSMMAITLKYSILEQLGFEKIMIKDKVVYRYNGMYFYDIIVPNLEKKFIDFKGIHITNYESIEKYKPGADIDGNFISLRHLHSLQNFLKEKELLGGVDFSSLNKSF